MTRPKLKATSTDGTTRCARCLATYPRGDAVRCSSCAAVRCPACISPSVGACKACIMVKSLGKSGK